MSPTRVRQTLAVRPFHPFIIHTGDGSSVRVKSPEYAALAPGGRTLVVFTDSPSDDDGAMHLIDTFLIAKVTMSSNGRGRGRSRHN